MLASFIANQVRDAFTSVPTPDRHEIVMAGYTSLDADEMAFVWAGRHWTQLTRREVFYHREAICGLSAIGYQAYVAAFLVEGLTSELQHGPDIRSYWLWSVRTTDDEGRNRRRDVRLSLLDAQQRAAIAAVLRHYVYSYRDRDHEALEVLRSWR